MHFLFNFIIILCQAQFLVLSQNIFTKNLAKKNKQNNHSIINDNNAIENNLFILIKHKKEQIDNLIKKLSSNPDIGNVVIPKIKELNFELDQLHKGLDKSNDKTDQSNSDELNFSPVKNPFGKCSIIDTLTQSETKELIKGLIKNITWNGTTSDLVIYFNGKNED